MGWSLTQKGLYRLWVFRKNEKTYNSHGKIRYLHSCRLSSRYFFWEILYLNVKYSKGGDGAPVWIASKMQEKIFPIPVDKFQRYSFDNTGRPLPE